MVGLGQKGVASGWGKLSKIPYKGVEQKRGEGKKIKKKGGGGKLGQGMGALRRVGLEPPYKLWIFSTAKFLTKIESLQKRAVRFLYNDYSISYEDLLEKAGKVKISVNRLRNLSVEIYKTKNKLNPEFVNNIFKVKENKRLVREQ